MCLFFVVCPFWLVVVAVACVACGFVLEKGYVCIRICALVHVSVYMCMCMCIPSVAMCVHGPFDPLCMVCVLDTFCHQVYTKPESSPNIRAKHRPPAEDPMMNDREAIPLRFRPTETLGDG